ncbi:MAG: nucleotidyltransferase domain-containing protein, partial [Nitrospirales bacterium]
MTTISLDHIPDTPHLDLLQSLAELAWANPAIQAIWVGGSIASGKSDQESDIDFRIAIDKPTVEAWAQVDWDTLLPIPPVGMTTLRFGPKAILHHMLLANGILLDYLIQTCDRPYPEVAVKLIAARNEELADTIRSFSGAETSVHVAVDPDRVEQLFVDYWIL